MRNKFGDHLSHFAGDCPSFSTKYLESVSVCSTLVRAKPKIKTIEPEDVGGENKMSHNLKSV